MRVGVGLPGFGVLVTVGVLVAVGVLVTVGVTFVGVASAARRWRASVRHAAGTASAGRASRASQSRLA